MTNIDACMVYLHGASISHRVRRSLYIDAFRAY